MMLKVVARRMVSAVPSMAWLLFRLMSSWCALVTHAPLFSSRRVFSSGSSRGWMVSILVGGHTQPSAVLGWLAESSSAQKMAAKIMASEIMGMGPISRRRALLIEVWHRNVSFI
mmetsp:Transcript_18346/g.26655  ORF Transcript_18346/g.26655 Transcript_18346/m.26655 type:complete len:114 (-) Transcript_18346:555-896(-)